MSAPPAPGADIAVAGWQVAAGFATPPDGPDACFFAVHDGQNFGQPQRGIIAIMAAAHAPAPAPAPGQRDKATAAVQSCVHLLAEGYFGARRTLSASHAASLALTAVNRWLAGQPGGPGNGGPPPVSLTALILAAGKMGVLQAGTCQAFRQRGATVSVLIHSHFRVPPEGGMAPTRAAGLDREIASEYAEDSVQPGDRFLLLGGLERPARAGELTRLAPALAALEPAAAAQHLRAGLTGASGAGSAMVLEVRAVPEQANGLADRELAGLKLRPAPREGEIWDGFRIGATLYMGRYTVLKAAFDTVTGREVALKIPLPSMLQDEIFTAGFLREAWIGGAVRGNVVMQYIELPPGRRTSLYLVMPLYHGETLERRLNRAPPVSLPEGIGIGLKLCEAVQDLAALQIVHRDIKPDNIMVLERRNEVKLLDLGLAYLPGIDLADAAKPGGTIRYMAPELLKGVAANARSEIYAIGVTLYRMFAAGAYPFGQRERRPLARLRPDLPPWLGEILGRALAADPAARFADAEELARALQLGLVEGRAPAAPRPPRIAPLEIWRLLALAFALGFFLLLLRALA